MPHSKRSRMPINTHMQSRGEDPIAAEPVRLPRVEKRIHCVREAAHLRRSETSLRHLVERGRIRCIRADGRVMSNLADLDSWALRIGCEAQL
jgi:hypothetical protein